ncbi:hypothetical protein AK812_SmicGene36309 [Symbiodinium microadriaticum]|uniref:Uncharacterized protein n=1 Tax=Symbiodinium microadriaticum TaxID=2951 RepID=A0A1Q9CJF3_SYMMI|nr:hypothetical protein AK812_SmicGene36309 [Symbiodinium microadriaticum]
MVLLQPGSGHKRRALGLRASAERLLPVEAEGEGVALQGQCCRRVDTWDVACCLRGALSGSWWWAEVAPHRDISPDCLAAILNVAALAELTAIDRCSDRDSPPQLARNYHQSCMFQRRYASRCDENDGRSNCRNDAANEDAALKDPLAPLMTLKDQVRTFYDVDVPKMVADIHRKAWVADETYDITLMSSVAMMTMVMVICRCHHIAVFTIAVVIIVVIPWRALSGCRPWKLRSELLAESSSSRCTDRGPAVPVRCDGSEPLFAPLVKAEQRVAGWIPSECEPVCTLHAAMPALSRTGLWPTEKSDGRRHPPPRSSGKSPLPAMLPPQLRRSRSVHRFEKAGFYFQLAAGLTSQLEVTLGLRTPEEAALGRDLFHAAEAGNAKQVRNLLAEGADALQRHAAGQVPLHVARSPEVVRELMAACPAAAGVRSFTGQTPVQRYMTLHHKLAEELLLAVASPAALEGLLEQRAGRSLLGLLHPSLARAVLQRASGRVSFVPSGFEAVAVLSQDPVSLGELRRLWLRLPKAFEARVLRHLLFENDDWKEKTLDIGRKRGLRNLCPADTLSLEQSDLKDECASVVIEGRAGHLNRSSDETELQKYSAKCRHVWFFANEHHIGNNQKQSFGSRCHQGAQQSREL